ncbi:MAG: hypothetical protein ABI664_04520 [bacterium]
MSATALGLLVMGACDNPQDTLLEQQQPQVILPQDVQNPTGAIGLYTGALGRLRTELNGGNNNQEALWNLMALMTDEFKSGDTFSQRNDADQRITQPNDGVMAPTYNGVQQARGRARDAISALKQYAPTETAKIGEMYMAMGFFEVTLGQNFCNGIPLGETSGGQPQYTDPLTNAQVFASAITRFDSALAVLTATDAQTVHVRNATLIAKARAQVNLDQIAAAATTVAAVPDGYQYLLTYSSNTQSNEWWQMGTSSRRYTVGDSFDVSGVIKNAIPFASLDDPRVKTARSTTLPRAFDNITPFIEFTNYAREDAIPLLSGIDARLIEGEARLRANDIAGMMTILNKLRTTQQKIGNFSPATQTALPTPATQTEATNVYFREKALWQFGRGERISDLRRLVRQYSRTQDNVFPSGPFHKNGTYGSNVAFPVPDAEKANVKFTGCLDTKA